MSSSDKKFQDMLKQWFKSNTKAPSSAAGVPKYKTDFVIKQDILQEISPPNLPALRLKVLKDLVEIVEKKRLEENATEVMWSCVEDLIRPPAPADHRHQVLEFLRHLVTGQRERIQTPMRLRIFALVKNSTEMEDLHWMIEILKALTDNGRTLNDFEDQIPGFVLATLPNAEKAGCANEFLPFVLNIVKTNSGYLSDPFTVSLTRALCRLCCTTKSATEIANTLEVLDAVVRYSLIRTESLQAIIPTLCRLVNIEKHCPVAWRIMKNIVGTSVGTTAIYTMIRYCEKLHCDPALLRGAIFFLSLSLWGGNGMQVSKLHQSPVLVLPAFKKALNARHPIVTFECLHAVYRLIEVQKGDILSLVWNSVFQLLEAISKLESNNYISTMYHSVLNSIEELIANEQFFGDLDAFYQIVQQCSASRPESSIMKLIDYRKEFLHPIYPNWIEQVELFVKAFYSNERRPAIQTRAIEVLASVIELHRKTFGDELIEDVFIPHLSQISDEQDVRVRKVVARLIVEACLNSNCKHLESLMCVLRKILSLPFEGPPLSDGKEIPNEEFADVLEAVEGLIKIFKKKIYELPSHHARLAYRLLLEHIQQHLGYPLLCESATNAKYMIFDTFLQLRADSQYRIGLVQLQKFSPYLLVDHKFGEDSNIGEGAVVRDHAPRASPVPAHPANVTYVSLTDTCFAVIRGLMNEREWRILDLLLREVPSILSNKSLILSKNTNNIGEVCSKICQLVPASTNITPSTIRNAPADFNRNKFLSLVFPILTCFTSYHAQLDCGVQQRLIKTLERGVGNVLCSRVCITALALCTLEMQDTMHKLIPNVLFTVSKVSATVAVAEPMLVFLSTLVRLPKVYSDFQVEQFMAVFAIAVQFTNPFKFNHYIVSLAYYVIGIWFLRLKPNFVKNCIEYITAGLKLNIDTLLEQQGKRTSELNEDSALRRRSASLTDRVGRKRYEGLRPDEIDDSVMQYHMEMTETCMDLLGRYAFATYSAKPKRTGVIERIFKNGESRSWVMGNVLVTMTTSPCTRVASKHDLCEKCWVTCRFEAKDTTPSNDAVDLTGSPGRSVDRRRRHKTEQARKSSHEVYVDRDEKRMSRDDLYAQKPSRSDHELHRISFGIGDDSDSAGEDEPTKRCICWCQDWAEVNVRRPAGDTAWVMRIENDCFSTGGKGPLADNITGIFLPELAVKASTGIPDDVFDDLMALQTHFHPITVGKSDGSESEPPSSQIPTERNGDRHEEEDVKIRRQSSTKDWKACEVIPEEQLGSSVGKDPSPLDLLSHSTLQVNRESKDLEKKDRYLPGDTLSFDSDFAGVGMRERTQTLPSSMIAMRRPTPPVFEKKAETIVEPKETKEAVKSGSNTNFLFLQLYSFRAVESGEEIDPPMLIGKDRTDIELSIRNLDKTPCYETHKIGVLYAGPGQGKEETEILSNKYGSARYQEFLKGLGTLIRLKNADAASTFLGGLDTNGNDGEFAYSWNDGIVQVIYHVATLMPNKANDPKCNDKKRHIGNNYVTIVYNNSGEDYDISTIRCQFTHACVVIEPLEMATNYVFIKARPEVSELQYYAQEKTLISDVNLALFVRQLAVHANIVSKVVSSRNAPTSQALMDPYGSNWLHRLRQIKKIRSKLQPPSEVGEKEKIAKASKKFKVKDFTEFV